LSKFLSFILTNLGCFVHSLTYTHHYLLASFDPIERQPSLAVMSRQTQTTDQIAQSARKVRIVQNARSVQDHVELVARQDLLVDLMKDLRERVVRQDVVVVLVAVAPRTVVVVALVAVVPRPVVVVVVGLLVPDLATRISVETVPVVLGLLVPDLVEKGVLGPDLVVVVVAAAAACR
jgi:hypothetical protein